MDGLMYDSRQETNPISKEKYPAWRSDRYRNLHEGRNDASHRFMEGTARNVVSWRD